MIRPSFLRCGEEPCAPLPAVPQAASKTSRNRTTGSVARGRIVRMLRAALLGVLTLTAVSCKSHDAGTSASQTVAAGKVIEVVGTVTLHHGTDTRPLAKGDMIDADDVVETGADGSAVIENQNNNV